ncbi:PIN domain-containing protein [Sulfurisphaera tokodaii]|uniref:Toxin n=1 Tax=Sulfurisphaera tokodaii (strain DSM 16993 / JCM 10545 / NBRC 100140 / 7) TaxID=273063 RepID=Q974B3_SULTO|nr:PIN domain-containing protein [Sulfurisphaera tokodaii]BAB65747.1 putative toxin [Sulfurisphaera tokodaii str. 7]
MYSTFEDSERHKEAMKILTENEVVIPQIVVYEYIWVLARLTNNVDLVKQKLEELKDFEIAKEDLEDMIKGIEMLKKDNKPIRMLNDYIILAIAKRLNIGLATYDIELVKAGVRNSVNIYSQHSS